ncbi:MAG: dephospho-CoA kinase [Verrucomicrobiia bacterium]
MAKLVRIGLTGGIAAGKSTVAQRWQQAEAVVIEADELAHRVLEPGTPTWKSVVKEFGRDILNADQTINRPKLGETVFRDESKRLALNKIVHPAVLRMLTELLAECEREGRAKFAVATIPLLYEVGIERDFDCVVTVACSEQTQLARLMANGFSEEQARARISAQWPMQKKMDRADFVIWNDGTRRMLSEQADIIWAIIKENCHAKR